MANENPGLDAMRQATANQPGTEGKEPEPIRLLRLANKELGEDIAGRLGVLKDRLMPYLGIDVPASNETMNKDPELEPVLIIRLIKENRQGIAMIITVLDSLVNRIPD